MINSKIARELVVIAKKIASLEPSSEYKRQSDRMELSLNNINKSWKRIKQQYEKQVRENPKSWKGIGNGSDLGHLLEECEELEKAFKNLL